MIADLSTTGSPRPSATSFAHDNRTAALGRPCGAALESAPGRAVRCPTIPPARGRGFAAAGGGNPSAPKLTESPVYQTHRHRSRQITTSPPSARALGEPLSRIIGSCWTAAPPSTHVAPLVAVGVCRRLLPLNDDTRQSSLD